MADFWSKLKMATSAFIGAFYESSVTLLDKDDFESYSARLLRYEMAAASLENTSYRDIHAWAKGLRATYGLSKYIADVYNPTAQIVDFYTATIWRGNIASLLKGGAIPLVVSGKSDEDKVRLAADNLLRVSNFEIGKGIAVGKASNLGDVGLKLVDDVNRGQVRIEVIDPSEIEDIVLEHGIIKAYRLTKVVEDENGRDSRYTETCERGDNEDVIFRTFINNVPAAWPGNEFMEWSEPYGFIPFWTIQHRNIGAKWGLAEAHNIRPKIMAMDDQATLLNDWLRRASNSVGLISGMDNPAGKITTTTSAKTANNQQPGREEDRYIWAGNGVSASYTPLIAPLDIANAAQNIQNLLASIKADMPELRDSIWQTNGDTSGVAIAIAREPAEAKIIDRRTNYDGPLTGAIGGGIAIGGWRGYKGYDGFDLRSYERGQLDISIAPRPVFPEQRNAQNAEKTAFWAGWSQLAGTGTVSFESYARDFGWTDDMLKDYGTQRKAQIELEQEDVIPQDGL